MLNKKVSFLDLSSATKELRAEIDTAVKQVLDGGRYVMGPALERFEHNWAEFCGARHAVGLSNGLDALTLALRALDIRPGDEVVVPAHTFIATWLSVAQVGAKIVPVEPNISTYNVEPCAVEAAISKNTKAIIVVHLYGRPVDIEAINRIAKRYKIPVVEDAAQAHGAEWFGRRIGAYSDVVCWSFYPGKNLGAVGDAGAVTTNRQDIYQQMLQSRNYGSSQKYHHEIQGVNARLDEIQAAILDCKLNYLNEWNNRRREIALRYNEALERACNECEPSNSIILPRLDRGINSSWHIYAVRTDNRKNFQNYLNQMGIETIVHYPIPPHKQPAFAREFSGEQFPTTEKICSTIISLPIGPHLDTCDQNYIIECIQKFVR